MLFFISLSVFFLLGLGIGWHAGYTDRQTINSLKDKDE